MPTNVFNLLGNFMTPLADEIIDEFNTSEPRFPRRGFLPVLPFISSTKCGLSPYEQRRDEAFHAAPAASIFWYLDPVIRPVGGADRVVAMMPDGLDTMVGERGARLSGGERQRLILARALLRNPALLILDEATNALDQESERAVWAVIDLLRGSPTVIVITHRLTALRRADYIAVLDGGRIVQFGKWDALTNEGAGRFAVLLHAGAITEDAKG